MLIGANSRTVAAAVDAKLQTIAKSLPPHIRAKTVLNRSKLVHATIQTVQKNLAEGALLVIAVLLLMLGNLRAALITALAIPLAMHLCEKRMFDHRCQHDVWRPQRTAAASVRPSRPGGC